MTQVIWGPISRFLANDAGTVAGFTAFSAPPALLIIMALSTYAHTHELKVKTQAVAAAAARVGASALANGAAATQAQAEKMAQDYFAANAPREAEADRNAPVSVAVTHAAGHKIIALVKYSGAAPTLLGPKFGAFKVAASAEIAEAHAAPKGRKLVKRKRMTTAVGDET